MFQESLTHTSLTTIQNDYSLENNWFQDEIWDYDGEEPLQPEEPSSYLNFSVAMLIANGAGNGAFRGRTCRIGTPR